MPAPGTDVRASPGSMALFPLNAVLFPGGLLRLKVFEARYIELIGTCLRDARPFGAVALRAERPAGQTASADGFETVGTLASLIGADSSLPGMLQVRCLGTHRFRSAPPRRHPEGLWVADVQLIDDDATLAPEPALAATVRALANTIATLKAKGQAPFLKPYRFDDAGWVANRWCEILPISATARQKLLELTDPMARLRIVDEFLRGKGVVG